MLEKIKWLGTLSVMLSVTLTSFNVFPLNTFVLLVGALSWISVGLLTWDKPLIVLNLFTLMVTVIGIYSIS